MTEVPVISIDHLTPSQLCAFQIADNALNENSDWSQMQLGQNLKELSIQNIDLLEIIGLDMAVIDLAIEKLEFSNAAEEDAADQNIERPDIEPISAVGDIWLLGPHRVMCGDARNSTHFQQLMNDLKAHAVFVDVPYNVRIRGHVSGKGSLDHPEFAMASGEMTPVQYRAFLAESLKLLVRYSIDGSLHFVCSDGQHIGDVLAVGGEVYGGHKAVCVWVKNNAGMGSLYRSQHELIAVLKNGRAPHRNNVELGRHGRSRTNVWTYPGANSFSGRNTDEGNLLALHPTVKPVQLVADAILDCTARGDIILDTFIGSGSTLIAAERVGRACYGMDIDPRYVDVTIRRWQRHTGAHAVHAVSGIRFNDVAGGQHG